jgi:thymidylate synthase (FAD)
VIPLLDRGFVRLVDVMGSDEAIAEAARASTRRHGQDYTPAAVRRLLRSLMRRGHTSPFEMAEIKLHCRMPIFVARQWIRTRTASTNEISGRYSELEADAYVPPLERLAPQHPTERQGSAEGVVDAACEVASALADAAEVSRRAYRRALAAGVAREVARVALPLSTYTEWYWKIDLHNLLRFLRQRLDAHAQYEIRVYAEAIAGLVRELFPLTWEAFEDYQRHALTLSRQEVAAIRYFVEAYGAHARDPILAQCGLAGAERGEFVAKLARLGFERGVGDE